MYRYGPCQSKRVLLEYALDLGLHLLRLLVYHITAVFPFQWLHCDLFIITGTLHQDIFFEEIRHDSDLAIEISMFRRRVILDEHDLCADLEIQTQLCRICIFREITADLSIE